MSYFSVSQATNHATLTSREFKVILKKHNLAVLKIMQYSEIVGFCLQPVWA